MIRNYGLDLEKEVLDRREEDWEMLGGAPRVATVTIPPKERLDFFSEGQIQRGREDFMDCVTRSYIEKIEQCLNYMLAKNLLPAKTVAWLKAQGYTDVITRQVQLSYRFNAMLSGTTRRGNSLKAPAESIRVDGIVPHKLLPTETDMTWDEYHNRGDITAKLMALGQESKKYLSFNYERVYAENYEELLEIDSFTSGVYAWPSPINGEYPATNDNPNHAIMFVAKPTYTIRDSYPEGPGDYIKKLASDYKTLPYGYRLFISATPENKSSWVSDIFKRFFGWL